ncbi:MAG: ABC transporter ATP-binding protein [Clostridia bacterium]|nr:ABC transporter ATP-binding protein [Clostridia bacterium]
MKLILRYMRKYRGVVYGTVALKLLATLTELLIPYVMEHLLDNVAPQQQLAPVVVWGLSMIALAALARVFNVRANRESVRVSKECAYEIRRDLFQKTLSLSGRQTDQVGLPSLTSRMTADSYNVQNFIRAIQTMGIRAPIMLVGGIAITLTMDVGLASILCVMAPVMIVVIMTVSRRGIPLYDGVQQSVDDIVRIMRENITGIRVVKALSREKHERNRFARANDTMARRDRKAGVVMALPGPLITLALNIGLTLVVIIGARRVNAGVTQPGVILAFLTYFNMILMGVMGLNRIFMMLSKANASANRIQTVIDAEEDLTPIPESQAARSSRAGSIVFDHVSFSYTGKTGEEQLALKDIDFTLPAGGSLGIIGPTGCGKTTVINLLMRFYDATQGAVLVNGKDVRAWDKNALRRQFGVVFQNDAVFADTLTENIGFGRGMTAEQIEKAAREAQAFDFIRQYADGFDHRADIRGANFSGGQRQRLLLSRALAGDPAILILDDASSALDYRTDAHLRRAIQEGHRDTTTIIIAQRISSIMNLDHILVLDDGRILGQGTHQELMRTCPQYAEIYQTQMGEEDA